MKHPFITFPERLLCFKYKPLGMYNYFFIYGNVHLRYNASFWKQNPISRDCEYIRFKPSEQSLKKIYEVFHKFKIGGKLLKLKIWGVLDAVLNRSHTNTLA